MDATNLVEQVVMGYFGLCGRVLEYLRVVGVEATMTTDGEAVVEAMARCGGIDGWTDERTNVLAGVGIAWCVSE